MVGCNCNEIYNINIMDSYSIRLIKIQLTNSKNLVQSKEFGMNFFTLKAKLIFTKLR